MIVFDKQYMITLLIDLLKNNLEVYIPTDKGDISNCLGANIRKVWMIFLINTNPILQIKNMPRGYYCVHDP